MPVALPILMMKNRRKQNARRGFGAAEIFQMKVTERERKIDGERKQRQ